MIKMRYAVQKRRGKSWTDLKEFATKEGAIKRILKLRKWFGGNKYRVKIL